MEIRIKMMVELVSQICPNCFSGTMSCIGNSNDGETEYIHECSRCGHRKLYSKCYPYMDEKFVKGEDVC